MTKWITNKRARQCLAIVALLGFALQPLAASLHLVLEEHTWGPGSHSQSTLASHHHHGHHHDHGSGHHSHGLESSDSGSSGDSSHEPHPIQDHDVNNEVAHLGSGSSPSGQLSLFAILPDTIDTELPAGVKWRREVPPERRPSSAHSGPLSARAPPARSANRDAACHPIAPELL